MPPNDDEELRALMRELVECGKRNAKREEPRNSNPFKDAIGTAYQIIGIVVVLLGLVGFLFSLRGDVMGNNAAINRITVQEEKLETLTHSLELRIGKLEK